MDELQALLIEDEDNDVVLIRELLAEGAGFDPHAPRIELRHASRLADGLRLDPREVDVVMLDLSLPDARGMETLQGARDHFRRAPILVLTGLEEEALGLQAVRCGAHDYLPKDSLDARTLWRALHYSVERQRRIGDLHRRVSEAEREESFKNVFGRSQAGLAIVDRAGQVRYLNRTADDLLARARKDQVSRLLQAPPTAAAETLEVRSPGGGIQAVEVRATETQWEGKPAYLLGLHDAGQQARAEREARDGRAREHRQARLDSLGRMASGLVHELNNLLMGVIGNVELARRRLFPDAPLRAHLDRIAQTAEQGAELVAQLQAFAGPAAFELSLLDLDGLVRQTQRLARAALPPFVTLKVESAGELPLVEADPAQVRQLLLNLVTNSAEALKGGGTVRVSTRLESLGPGPVEGLAWFEGGPGRYVALEVADDGPGMEPEIVPQIFDPFFTTKEAGHGLGLSAVLGIVRSHRGGIGVRTAPGQGTAVTVLIPVSEGRALPGAGDPPEADVGAGGAVLVVDDDPVVREIAREMLGELGFETVTASDGQEGIARFRERADSLDLALLDLTMPGLSGVETARELRRIREDVPLVLSSGHSEQELARPFSEEGFAAFLRKPYSLETLHACLRRVLPKPATRCATPGS